MNWKIYDWSKQAWGKLKYAWGNLEKILGDSCSVTLCKMRGE